MADSDGPGSVPATGSGRGSLLDGQLSGSDPGGSAVPGEALPGVRDAASVPARQREKRSPSKVPARVRTPGAEAVREALAPLAYGEAPRIGLLGDTGSGKTTAARALVTSYLKASPGMAVILDAKAERRFDDLPVSPPPAVRLSPAHYAADPPPPGTRVIIFRAGMDSDIDPEAAARFVVGLAARRWGSLLVHDELAQASKGGQWLRGSKLLPRLFVRGRTQGLAQLWGTTSPHDVPLEPFEQSSVIWQFAASGLAIRLLRDREYLRGIDPGVIEGLAGYPLPPSERGEFVALQRGRPWNGKIYKF